jgi:DNA polymerase III alpha subunit
MMRATATLSRSRPAHRWRASTTTRAWTASCSAEYSDGLICLTACPQGELAKLLAGDDEEGARQFVDHYRAIFGEDNFFIEIQDHDLQIEREVTPQATARSRAEMGVPLVATNDVHYLNRDDHRYHDVLMCIGTNSCVSDEGAAADGYRGVPPALARGDGGALRRPP